MSLDAAMERAAGLFGAGRLDEARSVGLEILRAQPDYFYALHLLGAIALRNGLPDECVAYTSRALAVQPGHVEVLCNRGIALRMLGRVDAALADYDRALALQPSSIAALNLKGVALAALNRHAEAIASYAAAIALDPGYAPARFNRSLSHLVRGELEHGWRDHESRWRGSDTQSPIRPFPQPQWQGEDLRGRTLLVHAEQGLGDTIQFCRYVPLLEARGARVLLEVQAPLKTLLADLKGAAQVLSLGESLPAFDLHCPMLSLPFAFGTQLDSIPASIPYLRAPEGHVERWRKRLGDGVGLRVGIAWSGNATLRNDRNRSIPFAKLDALRDPAWTTISLQKEIRDSDRSALDQDPAITRFENELADFRDTAALVSLLDVVVSVDTAVAHLAGAMGKPVWLLLPFSPDWRWLLDREDSPWYPTAKLFRQSQPGDWNPVLDRVARELRALA